MALRVTDLRQLRKIVWKWYWWMTDALSGFASMARQMAATRHSLYGVPVGVP